MESVLNDKFIKEFMKFFKMDLKPAEVVNKWSAKRQKQYECRLKRWSSLIDTHIDCEVWKARKLFAGIDDYILQTDRELRQLTSAADYEANTENHKKNIARRQRQLEEVVKQVKYDRNKFDEAFGEFLELKEEDRIKEAEEMAEQEEEDAFRREEERQVIEKLKKKLDIKKEVISEEDNTMDGLETDSGSEVKIKREIEVKEEYESEEYSSEDDKRKVRRIKREVKKEVKEEVDSWTYLKPKIKKEVKMEENTTLKVKKEYLSSEDDE